MDFWDEELKESDPRTPLSIIRAARDQLTKRVSHLQVDIKEIDQKDRISYVFEVTNKRNLRKLDLFQVEHQLDLSYPVRIIPPENDLPEFLRKIKYVPGTPSIAKQLKIASNPLRSIIDLETPGKFVEDEWVCVTASEFETQLAKLLKREDITARLISFISSRK